MLVYDHVKSHTIPIEPKNYPKRGYVASILLAGQRVSQKEPQKMKNIINKSLDIA
jgi:hypothetical protein